jgi:hypothetical protein
MKLHKDLREFIALLNSHGAEYLVAGAHCLAFHGFPRFTGDVDLFVRVSPENAGRLERVVRDFGFESTGLQAKDFLEPDQIIQLGVAPHRIDVLTSIDGVDFEDAWTARVPGMLDGLSVYFLSKELLIKNKLAVGRPQDIADVEQLRRIQP